MHSKPSPCGLRALLVLYAAHFIGGPLVVVVVPQEAHHEFSRTSDVYACCSAGTTRPYLGLPLRFRARRVVGILHTAVLGSQSEHLVGDVDMWIPLAAATLVTLLLALIALRSPHPASVYNACLPLLLLILSLLPFLGDGLGGLVGLVMIACYDACSMVFLLYIVDSARRLDLSTYILSAAYLGGSALSLLTGLGVGSILRR